MTQLKTLNPDEISLEILGAGQWIARTCGILIETTLASRLDSASGFGYISSLSLRQLLLPISPDMKKMRAILRSVIHPLRRRTNVSHSNEHDSG